MLQQGVARDEGKGLALVGCEEEEEEEGRQSSPCPLGCRAERIPPLNECSQTATSFVLSFFPTCLTPKSLALAKQRLTAPVQ